MKKFVIIIIAFSISTISFGQSKINLTYPLEVSGVNFGYTKINCKAGSYNGVTQPTEFGIFGLNFFGFYWQNYTDLTSVPGNILGWGLTMETHFDRYGWKTFQADVNIGAITIGISPSIYWESYSCFVSDNSGNTIGWTNSDFEKNKNLYDYTEVNGNDATFGHWGIGYHLSVEYFIKLSFDINITKYSKSFGVSICIPLNTILKINYAY